MSLSATLKPLFNSGDRSRGSSYYQGGLVYQMKITDGLLVAEVEGSYNSFYEVTLDVEDFDNEEAISCTCPRFDDGVYCKHIWATILKFDSVYGSSSTTNSTSRRLTATNSRKKTNPKKAKTKRSAIPQWQSLLQQVNVRASGFEQRSTSPFQIAANQQAEVHYVIDASEGSRHGPPELHLSVFNRVKKANGEWGKPKPLNFSHGSINELANPTDQKIAAQLMGADRKYTSSYGWSGMVQNSFSKFELDSSWPRELCELLVASGRLHWTLGMNLPLEEFMPIESIDFINPADICINITEQAKPKHSATMDVCIEQNGIPLDSEVVKIADNGVVLLQNKLIKISNPSAIDLWTETKDSPTIEIAKNERARFLKQLADVDGLPEIKLPDAWNVDRPENLLPAGLLKLHDCSRGRNDFSGEVVFAYGENEFSLTASNMAIYDDRKGCWSARNLEAESTLLDQLVAFPIEDTTQNRYGEHDFRINKKHLVRIVDELGTHGWTIQLLGKPIKHAGEFDISVESGQDWFDLSAKVNFDGETIALPGLLKAIAKKEHFVTLADGSRGRIPTKMIEKYARLADFGQVEGDRIRFRPTQAMLLDAMLDGKDVQVDKGFKDFRKKLKSFSGVKPKSPPRGFQGELRAYQSDGLGWLHFLREFKLGGCLADDMGLGKTIQVLSLLESRRIRKVAPTDQKSNLDTKLDVKQKKKKKSAPQKASKKQKKETRPAVVTAAESLKRKPSIVVVPKSLIFNWIEEAAKFTPRLRILNYTGTARQTNVAVALESGGFDMLITTYGTMRKDIADLSQIEFDYAILDESQAIKNSKAQCAKSSRLLRADHRLAMTGTPIENHLGELWSLFEFLNPGMLGGSTNFARLTNQKKSNEDEREQTLAALSKAISPFLLRRTKEQVLTDLPPKTEQTLYCDMLPAQKKAYNELKEYYRVKLAKKVETDGIGRSKIQVLEALLRLRQVACDPRLLDDKSKPGAKLELLGQQITEIVSEGHKVLVFSQFTSFLSLVKQQFDDAGINYEYLDGKTSNRAKSVKRFQEDQSVSAFLISIKAGGHGLNLTAADYVFILDPWWNPAVEAQAIDRAHRMGQQNPVIAYRMICRDTVEEKIVSLQESKRDLADKIVRSDESLIRSLTVDDLQVLFE